MRNLLTCLFSLLMSQAIAQAPGYMGKRFSFGYGLHGNPAFTAFFIGYGDSPVNIMHEAFVEYATSTKWSIGFAGKFYNTTYNNTGMVTVDRYNYHPIDYDPSGYFDIRCRNYTLYFKAFKRAYLAPWGRFFTFGLTVFDYTTTYNPAVMRIRVNEWNGTETFVSPFGPRENQLKGFDFVVGNGHSRIIADRVCLEVGYTAHALALTRTVFDAFDDDQHDSDEYIEKNAGMRVRGINRFNFYAKVGLIF
jgi:hypothetical protein